MIKIWNQAKYILFFIFLDLIITLILLLLRNFKIGAISTISTVPFTIILLLIYILTLSPWIYAYSYAYLFKPKNNEYKDISSKEANINLQNSSDIVLFDVRSDSEYRSSRIKKAIHIPYRKVQENLDKIEKYKEKEVYVYCAIGHRSRIAARELEKIGFQNIKNIVGGIQSFKDHNYPIDK